MTIQPIGSASVALYITPADLKEHGLTSAGLTLEQALELTRTAFRQAGIDLEGAIEIEAYPESCGVLVFAHVRAPERCWFSFGSLEDLAAAARALSDPRPDAALLWWEDRWWLSLPTGAEQAAARLSEFGRSETHRPHLAASLAEHGRTVLSSDALTGLLTYFPV
ncbi:adaptor protein MecA [Flavonifractor sp. AGMB03687]|uniref:adaptor protein MecA n=1 Tax=Flavonifractor sp. AGMB03687 TaxID=2785133 RepID=UPI001AE0145C|nr:adaptor protein MecA [Flavonifractor sp. AGMB03687]